MGNLLESSWSARTRQALREGPVRSRGAAANTSPTSGIDDELYELTGRRGMPVVDDIVLGYPATLDESEHGPESSHDCLWGHGRISIRLDRRPDGEWITYDLGEALSWRAAVELLVIQQEYRSWIPELRVQDARTAHPRRSPLELTARLGLVPEPSIEAVRIDSDILYFTGSFWVRTIAGLERLVRACDELQFNARFHAPEAQHEPRFVPDLEGVVRTGSFVDVLRRTNEIGQEIAIQLQDRDAVRHLSYLSGGLCEVLEARPSGASCFRLPPPELGNERLRSFLRRYALTLPPAPPPVRASAAMSATLDEVRRLGRLFLNPPSGKMWLGLWCRDDLLRPLVSSIPREIEIVPSGASRLSMVEWPVYRWGDFEMVCVGGPTDYCFYFCDQMGGIWLSDPAYDGFDFIAGSLLSWLEAIAATDSRDPFESGPLLAMPMKTISDLPAHLGTSLVPERSDQRHRLYMSPDYVIHETIPTRGVPLVEVRGRSGEALVPVLAWAKEHWGTRKAAISGCYDVPEAVADAAHRLGIQLVDGEPGGWKPEAFWRE